MRDDKIGFATTSILFGDSVLFLCLSLTLPPPLNFSLSVNPSCLLSERIHSSVSLFQRSSHLQVRRHIVSYLQMAEFGGAIDVLVDIYNIRSSLRDAVVFLHIRSKAVKYVLFACMDLRIRLRMDESIPEREQKLTATRMNNY